MLIAMTREQFNTCLEKGWGLELENYDSDNTLILKNNLSEKEYKELSNIIGENPIGENTIGVKTVTGLLEVYQYVLTFVLIEGVGLKYITINQGSIGEMDLLVYSAIVDKLKNKYPAHDVALVNDLKMKVFEHKSSPMMSRIV